ncbi:hypothetical protein TIFTF001_022210 [Ficus carica]|uniref:DDE Tnp4 domain-containing protein n=1 Tax=Ficus carica TaxID=3494 RepID=A0AA88AVL4_FICCA|nr:hypothetical protein TIFTF001_022210 [Ficus carica]
MEISSSVPFLNQDDFSHFFSLFPEMDDTFGVNLSSGNDSRKRRRKDGQDEPEDDEAGVNASKNGGGFKEFLASLMLLDEDEKQEQKQREIDFQQDKFQFDSTFNKENQVMNNYYNNLEQHYSQLNDLDQSRAKRARRSASSSAVTAVAAATAVPAGSSGEGCSSVQSGSGTGPAGHHRRLWVKDRSKDWWDQHNHPDFPEEEFRKDFRMSKATFGMICNELDSTVMKKNTMLREAIPVRQRVAVCIWRLATGEPLRLVSKRFGLGISTCHKLVLEVCSAIKTVLMPKFLQWPDEQRMRTIKNEFEAVSGIQNVAGAVYTTHIPIIAPKISVAAYFNKRHTERNQKTSYSITVQGVVDPKGVFTDICIGWPGSMPDDQVLEKSALFQRANRGLLRDVWIVGNSGFPLLDWVLVPYTKQNLTWSQHAFNEKIGDVQNVAKEAFARLKGRWSCLQKRTEVKLQDLPVVLGACCVLHNICEMNNDVIDPTARFELFDDEMVAENSIRSANAVQKRDQIAHNLLHHGLAGASFL